MIVYDYHNLQLQLQLQLQLHLLCYSLIVVVAVIVRCCYFAIHISSMRNIIIQLACVA